MAEYADVVVVGGGVIGCSIARRLAQIGMAVTLVERDRPGAEASSAAAGILIPEAKADVPAALLALWRRGLALYPALMAAILEETGMPVEYRRTGRLVVALDDAEDEALVPRAAEQRAVGIRSERLDAATLREAEPALTESARGALYFPEHALVDNARLATALGIAAARAGVRLLTGQAISELLVQGNAVQGVRAGGMEIAAPVVVNAAGSWAGLLDRRAWLPVAPAKGQMVAFQSMLPPLLRHIVSSRYGSTVPRADGRILHGATVEDVGYDKRVTAGAVAQLLTGALTLVPALAGCALEAPWAGLRPRCTLDGLPIIGADPRWRGLYHATGHFTMGIISAPATAEAMAHLIAGTPNELDLAPFAPARLRVGEGAG